MDYSSKNAADSTTPICRCRVLYLGSAVPHLTKEGLQGVQEPLRELYPECGVPGVASSGAPNGTSGGSLSGGSNAQSGGAGIDSWISVWSNGILVENVDDFGREMRRFFSIESLHYCAAVRYVQLPAEMNNNGGSSTSKFLPLDSPFLRHVKSDHPPLFACILRRTTGIKVLECHAFICKRETAANALVRCCFHAYADNMYVKQMDENPYSQIEQPRSNTNALNWQDADCVDADVRSRSVNDRSSASRLSSNNRQKCNELSSDNELPTSGSSIGNPSPEDEQRTPVCEEEEEELLSNYKRWSGSKSLSGSVKNLHIPPVGGSKLPKGLSMRSLRPRQIAVPSVLSAVGWPGHGSVAPPSSTLSHSGTPAFHHMHPQLQQQMHQQMQQPIYAPLPPRLDQLDKASLKLLKKIKSKSLASLVNGPISPPVHPSMLFMQPNGQPIYPQPFAAPFGMPPPGTRITGNIHTIKKKSKKSKEKAKQAAMAQQQQLMIQHHMMMQQQMMMAGGSLNRPPPELLAAQPMYMPPMRPLTPLSNSYAIGANESNGGGSEQSPVFPPHYAIMQQQQQLQMQHHQMQSMMAPRRKAKSVCADPPIVDEDSPFSSGIYRRKGHLNERAFSYSIRQEQRSRSGSLANLCAEDELDTSEQLRVDQYREQNGVDFCSRTSSGSLAESMRAEGQLSNALQQLQLDQVPKTASIKRSLLNGGQRNGKLAVASASLRPPIYGDERMQQALMNRGSCKLRQVQPPAPPTLIHGRSEMDLKKKKK